MLHYPDQMSDSRIDVTDNPVSKGLRFFICFFVAFFSLTAFASSSALLARDYKMAGDSSVMRVVVHFDQEPELNAMFMRAPHRLVVDLPSTSFQFDERELAPRGMVTGVNHGAVNGERSRLVISFDGPFVVQRMDVLENEKNEGFRLVVDVVAASEEAFENAMAEQIQTTGAASVAANGSEQETASATPVQERRFRVVIDPGHGGIDTGAEGVSGTQEKTITLAFGLELRKKLEDTGKFEVFLTRDHDIFLRLDERVRIARQHGADLFISIHADAIRLKDVRGATVYTGSDRASDAEAAAKAIRENLADAIDGIEIEEEQQEVADILADLIRRETQSFSIRFARSLVSELSGSIGMIPKNPHRFAGFRVLRAPDVPSVLLELGYLSNPEDEEQLRDPEWRNRAADGISQAITLFAAIKQSAGG